MWTGTCTRAHTHMHVSAHTHTHTHESWAYRHKAAESLSPQLWVLRGGNREFQESHQGPPQPSYSKCGPRSWTRSLGTQGSSEICRLSGPPQTCSIFSRAWDTAGRAARTPVLASVAGSLQRTRGAGTLSLLWWELGLRRSWAGGWTLFPPALNREPAWAQHPWTALPLPPPLAPLCFYFFGLAACGILIPRSGIKPMPPAWKLRVLTTRSPRKSPVPLSTLPLPPWFPLSGMLLSPLLNVPRPSSLEAQSQVHWSRRPSWYPQKIEVSLLH